MKREKKLTKRERKAIERANAPAGAGHSHHQHIHCTSCGRHLDEEEFETGTAIVVTCAHKSSFPSCATCRAKTQAILDEHDRTGQPVQQAAAWHLGRRAAELRSRGAPEREPGRSD